MARMRACEVVVLGAGMSGLCCGAQLRRAGVTDFVIVEQSPGLGGTWWDNRYPGAQVDVPAPLYSFSFAPNRRWKRRFADAAEIQAYMQQVAQSEGVLPHCRFGERITTADFDAAAARWVVRTDLGNEWHARHLVLSTGPLSRPRLPDVPGIGSFGGRLLHSARWDPGFDTRGLRVGVIGTGSTASQLVPPLAADAAQLTVFQRTPNWVLPRLDRSYGALDRALAAFPPWAAAVRTFWYGVLEWGRLGFEEGSVARRGLLRTAEALLRRQVADEALRARLRPAYPLGCKRLIYSSDWYRTLVRPNVALVTEAIERVQPEGVRTADGRLHALDALVCATGFDVEHSMSHVVVRGRGGVALADAWREGPQAHRGLTVAGFPNLTLMLGPNTATGHTSTLLYIEPGVRWMLRAMAEARRRGCRTVEVRPEAQQAWTDMLQRRLAATVWSGCRSWYRAANGRNIALWPGFTREYVRALERCRFEDYAFA